MFRRALLLFAFLRATALHAQGGAASTRSFPGKPPPGVSSADLTAYVYDHLRTPELCVMNDIYGLVLCRMYGDASGRIGGVEIRESVHPLLDSEAVRVLRGVPLWERAAAKAPAAADSSSGTWSFDFPVLFRSQSGTHSFANRVTEAVSNPVVIATVYGLPVAAAHIALTPAAQAAQPKLRPDRLAWLAGGTDTFAAPAYRVNAEPSRKNRALYVEATIEPDGTVSAIQPVWWPRWAVRAPAVFDTLVQAVKAAPPRRWTPAQKGGKPIRSTFLLALTY